MERLATSTKGNMLHQKITSDRLLNCGINRVSAESSTNHGGNTTVTVCVCRQQRNRKNTISTAPRCQLGKHEARRDKLYKVGRMHYSQYCRIDQLYTMSLRLCLYGFITWLLIANPIVCDILREAAYWTGQPYTGRTILTEACRGGEISGNNRNPQIRFPPLKLNEFLPRYSEQSPIASGPARGPVHFNSSQLETVLTTMIVFKDDEENMEDRKMTKRCEDKLLSLALLVTNELNSKLQVTEAWAPQGSHGPNSLHYEGRAVDINLADRDTSKYPYLARLAYEAGFDWVHYESKHHIHCSVRSDDEDETNSLSGRCFPGDAKVLTTGGKNKLMSEVRAGDEVLSVDHSGTVVSDTVLTFMDVQTDSDTEYRRHYVSITTETGLELRLTSSHLVYVSSIITERGEGRVAGSWNPFKWSTWRTGYNSSHAMSTPTVTFAGRVVVGQYLYGLSRDEESLRAASATLHPQKIVSVHSTTSKTGAYAPLTSRGTIIVDGAAASCYAAIESDTISHTVMWPVRMYHTIRHAVISVLAIKTTPSQTQGISLYAKLLHDFASNLLPESIFVGA